MDSNIYIYILKEIGTHVVVNDNRETKFPYMHDNYHTIYL